jgi:UrcA family protein
MKRPVLFGVALAGLSAAAAGAALAQSHAAPTYSDGIVVYGRAPSPGEPYALSQTVSYRDLDLSTRYGVETLKWRIAETARALCADIGERPEREQNTTVLPSCQGSARESAAGQVMRAVRDARYRPYYASR